MMQKYMTPRRSSSQHSVAYEGRMGRLTEPGTGCFYYEQQAGQLGNNLNHTPQVVKVPILLMNPLSDSSPTSRSALSLIIFWPGNCLGATAAAPLRIMEISTAHAALTSLSLGLPLLPLPRTHFVNEMTEKLQIHSNGEE